MGKTDWTREEVMEFDSFKTAILNIVKSSNRAKVSESTKENYLGSLRQYLQFVNSEEKLSKIITPDNLITEAQTDMEGAKDRIKLFFLWLQGEPVPNFRPRGKSMKKTSAFVRAYAQMRGFYTNNSIVFGKWKTPSLADMKKEGIENDVSTPFFKLSKKRKIFLDRGLVKQFLTHLKFRDVTIFLAGLSSSQDSGDLLSLNVGDIRKQKDRERFYWEGQRSKTEVRFKTFFSVEATDFIRRYIEQERKDAKDNEPLFLTTTYRGQKNRLTSNRLGCVFLDAARRMGVKLEEGFQNPFRPKRLRHIFRTACTHAHIDEGYINAFMGHKTSVSKDYLEKPITFLELEYSKAEPFLTVYGAGGTEGLEKVETELADFKSRYIALQDKVDGLETKLKETIDTFAKNVEIVARDLFNRLYEEDRKETIREQQFREEKGREIYPPAPKEKISKIEEPTEVEPKPSPKVEKPEPKKREPTFRELILGKKEE